MKSHILLFKQIKECHVARTEFVLKYCSRSFLVSYINNRPTRCNTKQSIYYSASFLYMFRVSTTSIVRSTQLHLIG